MRCALCGHSVKDRLILYPAFGLALIDGEEVFLRPAEARILEILDRQQGMIISGKAISDITGTSENSVKTNIYTLRPRIYRTKLIIKSRPGREGGWWREWVKTDAAL